MRFSQAMCEPNHLGPLSSRCALAGDDRFGSMLGRGAVPEGFDLGEEAFAFGLAAFFTGFFELAQ